MKKKWIALSVVLVMSLVVLAGCGIFVVNAERDYHQTVAEIEYKGMKATVTKGELLEYFAQDDYQTAYAYHYYYGWSDERILEEFTKTLAKKELLLLKARDQFATILNIPMDSDLEKFLRPDELKYVREVTNRQFQEQVDALVKQRKAEDDRNKGNSDDEEEETKKDTPRPQKPKEELEYVVDDTITLDDLPVLFPEIASDYTNNYQVKAWTDLQKNLAKSYKDYDYYYQRQLELRLLEKYKEEVNKDITVTNAEIEARYNLIIAQNLASVLDEDSYQSAFDTNQDSLLLYHTQKGYFKVRNILMSFSESQKAIIEVLKKEYGSSNEADYLAMRTRLAVDQDALIYGEKTGIYVNISNPDYDEAAVCEKEDCDCTACDNHAGDYAECDKDVCDCVGCVNNMYLEKNVYFYEVLERIAADMLQVESDMIGKSDAEIAHAKQEVFDEWLYKINDDTGVYADDNSLKEYTMTPKGKASAYVTEFTDLARALAEAGVGTCYIDDATADEIGATNVGGGISYVVTDFGVHIIMVTYMGVTDDLITSGGAHPYQYDNDAFLLDLDYVYDLKENKTVRELIEEILKDQKEYENYYIVEKQFFDEFEETSINIKQNVYNSALKEVRKVTKNW